MAVRYDISRSSSVGRSSKKKSSSSSSSSFSGGSGGVVGGGGGSCFSGGGSTGFGVGSSPQPVARKAQLSMTRNVSTDERFVYIGILHCFQLRSAGRRATRQLVMVLCVPRVTC